MARRGKTSLCEPKSCASASKDICCILTHHTGGCARQGGSRESCRRVADEWDEYGARHFSLFLRRQYQSVHTPILFLHPRPSIVLPGCMLTPRRSLPRLSTWKGRNAALCARCASSAQRTLRPSSTMHLAGWGTRSARLPLGGASLLSPLPFFLVSSASWSVYGRRVVHLAGYLMRTASFARRGGFAGVDHAMPALCRRAQQVASSACRTWFVIAFCARRNVKWGHRGLAVEASAARWPASFRATGTPVVKCTDHSCYTGVLQ